MEEGGPLGQTMEQSERRAEPGQLRVFMNHVSGVSKSRYFVISISIKYSNFSRFYKKMGPFYKKFRCDKFGNCLLPSKNDEFHENAHFL